MEKLWQLLAILAFVVCSFVVPIDKHHVSAVESSRHTSHHQSVATHKDNMNSDIVFDDLPMTSAMGTNLLDEDLHNLHKNKTKFHKGLKKKQRRLILKERKKKQRMKLKKSQKKSLKKKKLKTTPAPFLPFLDSMVSKKRVLRQKSLYDGENDDEDSDFSGSGSIPEITGDRLFQMSFTILEPWKDDYNNRRSSAYRVLLGNLTESLEKFFNDVLLDDRNHIGVRVRRVNQGANHESVDVLADITADQPVSLVKLGRELSRQIKNYRRIGKIGVHDRNYFFNTVKGKSFCRRYLKKSKTCADAS